MWRVIADAPEDLNLVAESWPDRVLDTDALVGFKIERPGRGLVILLNRHGHVLARARDVADVLPVLGNHLRALDRTDDGGSMRLEMRAVVQGDRAVLLGPETALRPGLSERALARDDLAIVDSPYVDLDEHDLHLLNWQPAGHTTIGHRASPEPQTEVLGLIWAGSHPEGSISTALVAHALAIRTRSGSRDQRLDLAVRLATRLETKLVPIDSSSVPRVVAQVMTGGLR